MGDACIFRNCRTPLGMGLIALWLAGASAAQTDQFLDQPIKGAFGKVLGEVFDPGTATRTHAGDGTVSFEFAPDTPLPELKLTDYEAAVSPLSYRIYGIRGAGNQGDREKCAKTGEALFYTVIAPKYGGKTYDTSFFEDKDHNGWDLIQSRTQREIRIACDERGELSLRYLDKALGADTEAERREQDQLISDSSAGRYEKVLPRVRELAGKHNLWAQTALGFMYSKGYAVEQDDQKAEQWYGAAARAGWHSAEFNLGVFYQHRFRARDAETWLLKAAEAGLAMAQENLGQLYYDNGAIHSLEKSFFWTLRAAENGRVEAQYNTCFDYADGIGVGRDMVEAYKWCYIAAHAGHEKATRNTDHLAKQMQPGEVSRGRAAAELWMAKSAPK